MVFVDIHTHHVEKYPARSSLLNVSSGFDRLPAEGNCSAGLHPWHLHPETAETEWAKLQKACSNANILAVGECGLDKACTTEWQLQEQYFIKQLGLANILNKPIVIHCVRAFDEILQILKKQQVRVPVIFHGFNKNKELASRIVAEGYYLSFGKHLADKEPVVEAFRQTPLDKVFLETDAADIDIQSVYIKAAELRDIPLEALAGQIVKNAIRLFGEKIGFNHE